MPTPGKETVLYNPADRRQVVGTVRDADASIVAEAARLAAAAQPDWDRMPAAQRARLLERGYNQSEWIARGLSAAMDVPLMSRLLIRSRNTRTQTALTRDERRDNVSEAFRTTQGTDIDGTTILLVDDTLTTGATLRSAARALVNAGAIAVAGAALRLDEEQPDDAPVIRFQTDGFLYGASPVGYNL